MAVSPITNIIRKRRSVFPHSYNQTPISRELIEELLENANWAPTHRLTAPWRFRVFSGAALQELSEYLGAFYKTNTPPENFSAKKYEKTIKKPLQSACVIAICMQRDPKASVPEWEEIAAVACAVQNMWLTATAYGIGAYWSSPKSMLTGPDILNLEEGERCLGLFYMGYFDDPGFEGKRGPIAEKVIWYE